MASKPKQIARYRHVYPAFWRDEKVIRLGLDEKAVALYCMTGPQSNRIGIFSFSPGAAAEDCATLPVTFARKFSNVVDTLRWRWDSTVRVLFIPTWWRWNQPANINCLKSALCDFAELPQTALRQEFAENIEYLKSTLHQTFHLTLALTYTQKPAHQEQEQEQNKEQEQGASACARPRGSSRFVKPTVEEVAAYCEERGNSVDPEAWMDHYTANGWRVGKNPMKDWKGAVRTWERNGFESGRTKSSGPGETAKALDLITMGDDE